MVHTGRFTCPPQKWPASRKEGDKKHRTTSKCGLFSECTLSQPREISEHNSAVVLQVSHQLVRKRQHLKMLRQILHS